MNMPLESLSSVASIFNGKTPAKAEQRIEGHPVLKIKDVSEDGFFKGSFQSFVDNYFVEKFYSKKIISGDSLILNAAHNSDYVGSKIYKAEHNVEGALATGEWTLVRSKEKLLDSAYLYYWLLSGRTKHYIRQIVKGIHLYPKDVARLKIPLPPLEEQKRIAAILDKADGIRRSRKEAIALTEELLRSTFLDMFGDPVTNPKGWETGKLDQVCNRVTDGTHQSPKWSTEGVPFLFVSNIIDGEIDFHVSKYITEECWASLTERCPIELDDILYTTVGSYGNAALVRTTEKFCFQRHIAHIKPNHDKVNPEFLLSLMQSPGIKNQADRQARGVAQKTLNLRELKEFEIFIPPRSEQDKYISIRRKIESSLTFYRECCDTQDNLFNSLLQKAFRGEL